MISTVTSSTVTIITSMAAMGLTAALGIAATVSLVIFLVTKELAGANRSGPSMRIAKFVNTGIWPLIMVFGVIVGITIVGMLP